MKEKTQIRIIMAMILAGVGILVAFGLFYAGRYKNRIEATEVYGRSGGSCGGKTVGTGFREEIPHVFG